ncbi:hypothetical protein F4U94_21655 [Sphingobium limneticum]|uniref:hypothetical protein n=1 Tax=Sphingobium limneticum TaxID=1007511 RepID=UPI00123DF3C6|nr:hypothetical protein [Sphingobium limneticum]KAA9011058.1 hypothetical protein F4U94_21655 [Sphingobium limneticum]
MKTLVIGMVFLAGAFDTPPVLVKPEVAAAKVAECGFKKVHSKFDDTLQEEVVEVLDVAPISDSQLKCAARASLATSYYVTFISPVEQAYQSVYWGLSREQAKIDARVWLDKRGLLSSLPAYDANSTDEVSFARSLEKLCGPKAAGTLQPLNGMATFKSEILASGVLDEETLWCLTNAAEVSGYPLGFMGNETNRQDR